MGTASLCFSNSFWGLEDSGVHVLLERMNESKATNEDIRAFYKERAAIEDEYARKLTKLSKMPLGTPEIATHASTAASLHLDVEEPHSASSNTMREKRKMTQATIEKLFRTKAQQQSEVKKSKERYQSDCLKLNSFLAQQNVLMGRELDKNNVKLEKVQTSLQESQSNYQNAVKELQGTVERWNREWKLACDTFQDLEEERITNLKASLWTYANILSQICVTDDESCEKLRLALEQCDVETDIRTFVETRHTGDEIADAPVVTDFRGHSEDVSGQSFQRARFMRGVDIQHSKPTRSNRADSVMSRNSTPGSRAGQRSVISNLVLNESPKAVINQYPLDGITQLCRSDSTATFHSASSVPASNVTGSSMHYSFDASNHHTPSASVVPHIVPGHEQSRNELHAPRRKSFIERAELSWPIRRSPSPAKSDLQKPLKAQKTGGSMFDALLPARSRSRAGRAAITEFNSVGPRTADVLHVGRNMFPVSDQDNDRIKENARGFTVHKDSSDPIAAALDELKTSQAPVPKVTSNMSPGPRRLAGDAYDHVGRKNPPLAVSRSNHNRIPSRSEPSSPVSGADFDYPMRQHPNTYTSNKTRGGGLGAPPAAHSAAEMRQTADRYLHSNQSVLSGQLQIDTAQSVRVQSQSYNNEFRNSPNASFDNLYSAQPLHSHRAPGDLRRSPSPVPPNPDYHSAARYNGHQQATAQPAIRAASSRPTSESAVQHNSASWSNPLDTDFGYESRATSELDQRRSQSPHPMIPRSVSPRPQIAEDQTRPRSRLSARSNQSVGSTFVSVSEARIATRSGREDASASPHPGYGDPRYDPTRGREPQHADPTAIYRPLNRARSKSFVDLTKPGARFTNDGREILALVVALYDYVATIPEEIGFCQGDTLAIVEMREDGWWLGEVTNLKHPRRGLVPSNFFRKA